MRCQAAQGALGIWPQSVKGAWERASHLSTSVGVLCRTWIALFDFQQTMSVEMTGAPQRRLFVRRVHRRLQASQITNSNSTCFLLFPPTKRFGLLSRRLEVLREDWRSRSTRV
jgi:hypothetical protein